MQKIETFLATKFLKTAALIRKKDHRQQHRRLQEEPAAATSAAGSTAQVKDRSGNQKRGSVNGNQKRDKNHSISLPSHIPPPVPVHRRLVPHLILNPTHRSHLACFAQSSTVPYSQHQRDMFVVVERAARASMKDADRVLPEAK
ncbi:hypothetical protein L1887_20572 [Cichorium endivia]|nr:hypothetical protein L1887_20572 [Cichorium endivia]